MHIQTDQIDDKIAFDFIVSELLFDCFTQTMFDPQQPCARNK